MSVFEQFGRWLRRRQGIERNPLYRIAADVVQGRLTLEQAYALAEQPATVARLADGDLWKCSTKPRVLASTIRSTRSF
jgi:hypothetical protein